jgi:hypothetical protein
MAYINGNTKRKGFSPNAKGFSLNSVHGSRIRIFLWILRQRTRVCAFSARVRVSEYIQNSKGSHAQFKGNHHKTNAEDKFHIYCRISNIPSTN